MKRSTEGLRDVLFDTLEKFQRKEIDANHVKAITSISNSILATVAKDLEAAALLDSLRDPNKPKALGDMRLSLPLGREVIEIAAPSPPAPEPDSLSAPPTNDAEVVDVVDTSGDARQAADRGDEDDQPTTGFGRLLHGVIHDHANGVTRHKGSRY